jgi:type VI secretion system protein ImpI
MASVLVIEAEATGERRRHGRGRLRIGRGAENDWRLAETGPQPSLSRSHCVIEAADGGFTVVDLGSTNGTRLNGRTVPPHLTTPLAPGDRLELGAHVLRLSLEDGERRPAPPPADPVFQPPPYAPARASGGPPRSLDTLLGGLVIDRPSQPGPDAPAALTADDDPLGGLFDEPVRPTSRAAPAPPPRDSGATPGDHAPPQLEAFALPRAARPSPPPVEGPAAVGTSLLDAFLEGAGIDPRSVSEDAPQLMRAAGAAFAAMAMGLRDLLATRALVKDHAGVARTVIGALDNNPLKYSVARAEAVRALLVRREAGYLEPLAAVEASLDDLKAHELALLEGVQAAVTALLAQFAPARLDERLGDASALGILLQGGRRAKLWDLYGERYEEIAEAARVRFMGDVDRAFVAAYERKVHELRARRQAGVRP